jgi:hypothetical protein
VGTPTLIGVPAPHAGYTARYLHHGDHPAWLIPLRRRVRSTKGVSGIFG